MVHPSTRRAIRSKLLAWYATEQRSLPWRTRRPDPYAVLVSEIMLQQTRVETVIPYFERFMERFPDLPALAEATEEEVLRYWSGLGYYRRGRNLRLAAQAAVRDFAGALPDDIDDLRKLPGIGAYTAGAVASIAFYRPEPLVDGNVERVLARLFCLEENIATGPGKKTVWELAAALVPENAPGDFNQALMELGALVCLPTSPNCGDCPVAQICRARREGKTETLPIKIRATKKERVEETVLCVTRGDGTWLLVDGNSEGLYTGMWQFPWAWKKNGDRSLKAVRNRLAISLGIEPGLEEKLGTLTHTVTFRTLATTVYRIDLEDAGIDIETSKYGARWVSSNLLAEQALPAYQKRVAERFLC